MHLWVEGFGGVFNLPSSSPSCSPAWALLLEPSQHHAPSSCVIDDHFLSGGIIGAAPPVFATASPPMIMALGSVFSALESRAAGLHRPRTVRNTCLNSTKLGAEVPLIDPAFRRGRLLGT